MIRMLVAIAVLTGCDRRVPISSCAQDLGGEYEGETGRWMIVDHGPRIEAFPLFVDVPVAGELEVAPRVIELRRAADGTMRGEARRRYMTGSTSCIAKVPVRVTACANDTLEVVLADTTPPVSFTPCELGRSEPARIDRWKHR